MEDVIQTHSDEHQDLRDLLPWYVTGQLDAAEDARIEAHLAGCAKCQAEIAFQRRLESEVARLPLDVEEGWSRMRRRIEQDAAGRRPRAMGFSRPRAAWLGWAVAASLLVAGVLLPFGTVGNAPAGYHVLGAAPASAAGNVVVIFRPDTTESRMRETLNASQARVVDGPTAADAYVLHVAPSQRQAALATLRGRSNVVLAEPIDSAPAP